MKPRGMFFAAGHRFFCRVAREQRAAQLARHAAAQANDALAVRRQQFAIDPRLVIKAFQKRLAGELDQVVKTRAIRGEHREVIARFALRHPRSCRTGCPARHTPRSQRSD